MVQSIPIIIGRVEVRIGIIIQGNQLSWFRAPRLHRGGRGFESLIAHARLLLMRKPFLILHKMFYVYILYSNQLDRYYVGSTQDVENRIKAHLYNHKGFTSKAKDWNLVYHEQYANREEAYDRERQIKKWKSRIKIEQLVKGLQHPDNNREGRGFPDYHRDTRNPSLPTSSRKPRPGGRGFVFYGEI